MPHNWKTYKLGEICEVIGGGTPSTKKTEYYNGDISWITPRDLSGYNSKYIKKGSRSITKLGLQKSSAKIMPKGTVLLSSRAPIGYLAIALNEISTNQGFKSLVVNQEFCYNEFIYYLLKNNVDVLLQNASGSTFQEISGNVVKGLSFPIPPLPEQRAIASILSTIDDQIENNLAMNKTLEEMAMALYKHWFVDFGPFQEGNFVESELGKIPEGWEVSELNSIIHLNPRLSIKKGEVASFVEMKVVPEDAMSVSNVAKKEFKSGTKFQNGDTLFARITPCLENGKTAFVDFLEPDEIAFGSTEFLILRAQEGYSKYWNYCLSRTDAFRSHAISCMVGTSGRQRVQNVPMMNFLIALAPKKIYQEFELKVDSLFQKIRLNTIENQTLIEQRDALLPKLVSGEARVKGFE